MNQHVQDKQMDNITDINIDINIIRPVLGGGGLLRSLFFLEVVENDERSCHCARLGM